MELVTREDIEAPIDFVFKQVTEFPTFERSIMRRGGDVDLHRTTETGSIKRWCGAGHHISSFT